MNEAAFIKKTHKALSSEIYKWKINDPYHGGVPDTYYSGPGDFCFVEYKYKPSLPIKDTSKIDITISKLDSLMKRIQGLRDNIQYISMIHYNDALKGNTNKDTLNKWQTDLFDNKDVKEDYNIWIAFCTFCNSLFLLFVSNFLPFSKI